MRDECTSKSLRRSFKRIGIVKGDFGKINKQQLLKCFKIILGVLHQPKL